MRIFAASSPASLEGVNGSSSEDWALLGRSGPDIPSIIDRRGYQLKRRCCDDRRRQQQATQAGTRSGGAVTVIREGSAGIVRSSSWRRSRRAIIHGGLRRLALVPLEV